METNKKKTIPGVEDRDSLVENMYRYANRLLIDGGKPQEVAILPRVLELLLESEKRYVSGN